MLIKLKETICFLIIITLIFFVGIYDSNLIISLNGVVSVSASENEVVEVIARRKTLDITKPMVALTFDDGPYTKTTTSILDTLEEHNVVATFFVIGNRVNRHRDIVRRMAETGNEIGNHSYNHKDLTILTSDQVKSQIDMTQNAISKVVGSKPKIMRPTYGAFNEDLKAQAKMPLILWSIDSMDWKSQDAEKIIELVLSKVRDGDIILMHDIFGATAEAVDYLVPELINMGFELVTVSELYESRGRILKVGNIYNRIYRR